MGKFYSFILIMSGLMLLFHFTGLIETGTTINSKLLILLLGIESFSFSNFMDILLAAVVGGGAIVGITVGIVTRNAELAVLVPFTLFIGTLMWDFLAVYLVISSVNQVVALLLFAPLLMMFGIILIDWWRGRV